LPVLDDSDQVPERPPQAVERHDDDNIDLTPMNCLHQRVKSRPRLLRATMSVVHELRRLPATGIDIPAKFEQLVVTSLFL